MREATVLRARMLSPQVRELTLDPGAGHTFVPGHWVTLYLDREGDEPLKRQYSIASAPRADGTFDIAVTLVPCGPMSTFLHEAKVGARIRMMDAQGLFVLEPMERPLLFVATGTGIAPFRAMLQEIDKKAHAGTPLIMLFGCRSEEDLLYRDELEALAARWPRFRYLPTLSRPHDGWSLRRGWVQSHLPELIAELGTDVDVYVCGLTKMVKDVRRICREELGVDRKRVHVERYD